MSPKHVDKQDRFTRDLNVFTHVHTELYTENTPYLTYVQQPHKDSTIQTILRRYTSIEDKQEKLLFWNEMDFLETFSETLANTAAWRAE